MKLNEEYERLLREEHGQELSEARKRVWDRLDTDNENSKLSIRTWIPWLLMLLFGIGSAYLWNLNREDRVRLQHTVDELRVELNEQKASWRSQMSQRKEVVFTPIKTERSIVDTIYLRDTVYHQPRKAEREVKTITRVDTVYRSVIEERKVEVPVIRYDTVYIDRPIKEEMLVHGDEQDKIEGQVDASSEYPDVIRVVLKK